MSYQNFLALLRVQSSLRRTLHVSNGRNKLIRNRAIRSINDRLETCPHYQEYLRRVVRSGVLIG